MSREDGLLRARQRHDIDVEKYLRIEFDSMSHDFRLSHTIVRIIDSENIQWVAIVEDVECDEICFLPPETISKREDPE
jgi:hypothetical protein